jgi:hypothetical protein
MKRLALFGGFALSLLALTAVSAPPPQPPSAVVEARGRFPSGADQTRTPMHPPVSEPMNLAIFGSGLIAISLAIRQKSGGARIDRSRAMLERSEGLASTG